ncbi:hypothetical protein BRC97_08100 [Halobacteriales archaeon QS_6_71_20]|nr:MAG: hypothetical protein BRC97_08100 [Halobacteriales archaeon QS_6_71_20]
METITSRESFRRLAADARISVERRAAVDDRGLPRLRTGGFADLPDRVSVGRYRSLCIERDALPPTPAETAWTDDDRGVVTDA